jgi:gamma-glutamylcyclotransferase (GGCT)/AIG2-like uncharacterized protein YtfP
MNVTRRPGFVNLHTIYCEKSAMSDTNAIFVYGTLKRGECRADCWPRDPLRIEPASTLGMLYDLGPYPALLSGASLVLGEIWTFAPEDIAETLRVLDEIECFSQGGVDLYVRNVVPCRVETDASAPISAHCYFLADASAVGSDQRIQVDPDGFSRWPGKPHK